MKDQEHRGITWRDFPGNCDAFQKKLNFSLFRRGRHSFNSACEGLEGEALKAKLLEMNQRKRARWGVVGK